MMSADPGSYWDKAGTIGYGEAMFGSRAVEQHVNQRLWGIAVEIGLQLGLDPTARVLDLGCGDGAFTNRVLARNFAAVDGIDLSETAISRAKTNAPGSHVRFWASDITQLEFSGHARYDGAFLIGILHHVKSAAPAIVRALRQVTDRIVVLEPNGNNVMRKLLELTPTYRAAGEASFRKRQVEHLLAEAGYQIAVSRRVNLFPNFTPQPVFRLLKPLEATIEATPGLRGLCTVDIYGCHTANGAIAQPDAR